MLNKFEPEEMKEIWQSQETEPMHMSAAEIRTKATLFERKIRRRNGREYIAAAAVILWLGWDLWHITEPLMQAACWLCAAGVVYVAVELHRRGGARRTSDEMGLSAVAFQRRELERQRDLLQSVWRWYIGPLLPGLALFIAAGLVMPAHMRYARLFVCAYAVVLALALIVIARWNQRAARRLQHSIDELDALGNGGQRS